LGTDDRHAACGDRFDEMEQVVKMDERSDDEEFIIRVSEVCE
jgi:hypothetical protein